MTVTTPAVPMAQPVAPVAAEPDRQISIVDFSVVHTIPGRIRLRVPKLKYDRDFCDRLEAFLAQQPAVHNVRIAAACCSVVVTFDARSASVTRIGVWIEEAQAHTARPARKLEERTGVGALLAGVGAAVATLAGAPPLMCAGLLAISAAPILSRALSSMVRERTLSVDVLDGGAVALLATRGNPFAAAVSSTLIAAGEYIRAITARRSRAALVGLLASSDSFAWIVRGVRREQIRAEELRPGDVVVVYAGELIPVDGVVLEGHALVDQKMLTGESIPVGKSAGDEVFASTLLRDGKLYVQTLRAGETTRASRVLNILLSTPQHETRLTNFARRFGDRLVLPTLGLAAIVYLSTRNLSRAISILIFDVATGIRVSAPTTMLASMTAAARSDILVKTGAALERLATIDTIVFDKTGTLTAGDPVIVDVLSTDAGLSDDEVLALAAGAEQRLSHPVAVAISDEALRRGIRVPQRVNSRYKVGMGVRAWVDGRRVRVGDTRYLSRKHVAVPAQALAIADDAAAAGKSYVLVSRDEEVVGVITYRDVPRPEAKEILNALRARGIRRLIMVSGDDSRVANAVAGELGLREVHAGVFPEEKSRIVRGLQAAGHRVAVIGDGINDSPALAFADVSFSIEGAAAVARESADIVLHGDLRGLPVSIDIARQSMRLIEQNFAIVATPNLAGMLFAASGLIGPLASTAVNNGSTIVAGLNSVRPLRALPAPDDLATTARQT